jgi:uncharacterized protein YndB with AHSA1/START domain
MLKKIGIGLGGIVALFVFVGFLLPANFSVSRSKVIKASPEVVFAQVNDVEKSQAWSPWKVADPAMKVELGTILAGKGASYKWMSDGMGSGELTIVESTPPSKIVNSWEQASGGGGKGEWIFEAAEGGTRATWTMSSDAGMNIVARYFGLMMDGMLGGLFDNGLDRLAEISEAVPSRAADAVEAKPAADQG